MHRRHLRAYSYSSYLLATQEEKETGQASLMLDTINADHNHELNFIPTKIVKLFVVVATIPPCISIKSKLK